MRTYPLPNKNRKNLNLVPEFGTMMGKKDFFRNGH